MFWILDSNLPDVEFLFFFYNYLCEVWREWYYCELFETIGNQLIILNFWHACAREDDSCNSFTQGVRVLSNSSLHLPRQSKWMKTPVKYLIPSAGQVLVPDASSLISPVSPHHGGREPPSSHLRLPSHKF